MARRFDREPVCCGVCRRQAWSIGYAPRAGAPILWLCQNPECLRTGQAIYRMTTTDFSFHENSAVAEAGDVAGAYLESIGRFGLDDLTPEQWLEFLGTFLRAFEDKMRARLVKHVAPF